MTTPPPPGFGEPRDVWSLRQEMTGRVRRGDQGAFFSPGDVLARLDECHPVPRPDEGGITVAVLALLRQLDEDASGLDTSPQLEARVRDVRRQIMLVADRSPGGAPAPSPDPARPGDEDTAPMADALRLIAGDKCTNFTGGYRCWQMGKTRGARYGADAWCEACVAQDALNVSAAPSVPPQPTVPRAPVEALLAALDAIDVDLAAPAWSAVEARVAEVRRHLNGDTT